MQTLVLTLGLLFKIILLLKDKISSTDIGNITISVLAGVFFSLLEESWEVFPLALSIMLVMFFKEKILLAVNEGALLVYGLSGIMVFFGTYRLGNSPGSLFNVILVILLGLFTLRALMLCLSRIKVGPVEKISLYSLYLAISSYVMYQTFLTFLISESSLLNYFLLGFYGLYFMGGIVSLFILFRGNDNKFDFNEEIMEVFKDKYHDKDVSQVVVGSIIGLFFIILISNWLTDSWITGLLIFLTLGTYIATSKKVLVSE